MQVGDLVKHKDGIKDIGLIVEYLGVHGYTKSGGLCLASIIIKIAQVSAQPKLGGNMQVGDLIWLDNTFPSCRQTCVQAKARWFNRPTGALCTWVNIRSLEVLA